MVHEMVIAEQILEVALREAEAAGARRVTAVTLELGELEGIAPEMMQESFHAVAKDSLAAGADVDVTILPGEMVCTECGEEVAVTTPHHGGTVDGDCPSCGGRLRVLHGKGWTLVSVRVET